MAGNKNGQVILNIIRYIGEPATVAKIVSHFNYVTREERNEIKKCVEETVEAGIRYGFLQRKMRKYFAAPVDQEAPEWKDEKSEADREDEVTDVARRARRWRIGTQRRSYRRCRRSRSRRRR